MENFNTIINMLIISAVSDGLRWSISYGLHKCGNSWPIYRPYDIVHMILLIFYDLGYIGYKDMAHYLI